MLSLFLFSSITFLFLILIKKFLIDKEEKLSSSNKCVLITGCDSGIGLETAKRLHGAGFTVIATCLNLDSLGAKQLICHRDQDVNNEKQDVPQKDVRHRIGCH